MVQVYRLFLDHTFLKALYCKRKHARVELTIKVIYLGKKHSKECPAQSHDDAFVQRVVVRVQHCLNGDTAGKHKNQEHPQPGHKVLLHLETKQEYVDELFCVFFKLVPFFKQNMHTSEYYILGKFGLPSITPSEKFSQKNSLYH